MTNAQLKIALLESPDRDARAWTLRSLAAYLQEEASDAGLRKIERALAKDHLLPDVIRTDSVRDEFDRPPNAVVLQAQIAGAKSRRHRVLFVTGFETAGQKGLHANDIKGTRYWAWLADNEETEGSVEQALQALLQVSGKDTIFFPSGPLTSAIRRMHLKQITAGDHRTGLDISAYYEQPAMHNHEHRKEPMTISTSTHSHTLSHLDRLEAESIHILREVAANAANPVMLYSIGKDSAVMMHLALKAFYPSTPPFPLLHVDTTWKFRAMYEFRDAMAKHSGMELIVHTNPEGLEKGINPFDHGSELHTEIMKTVALKQAVKAHGFDVCLGGARRDEEKSRAKERVFSFRTQTQQWDPKQQRPELWNLYNTDIHKGEGIRVFPLSNWTELDIWQYIFKEDIAIVPLYTAAHRPTVSRDGQLIMVDDDRFQLMPGEKVESRSVRFRTLGCYPLTAAVESSADTLEAVILELIVARSSEREGRLIDKEASASMEKKKIEGYF